MILLLLIARFLLAGIFAVAGAAKLADPAGSRKSMKDFGIPDALAPAFAMLLPLAELICAAAVLPLATAWWGACGVLALLLIFILGISFSLVRGLRPDCHCFGQLQSSPIGWDLVARNAILAAIAAFIVAQGQAGDGASFTAWWAGLSSTESGLAGLALALVALAAFQAWAFVQLLTQNGRLMLRVEALEKRSPAPAKAPAPEPEQGLPVNSDAPGFSLKNLEGETVTLSLLRQQNKPVVLLFIEPGCASCDALLPEVARWQRDMGERLLIVPISRGDVKTNRAKTSKAGIEGSLLQADREVAGAYLVKGSPGAVLIKNGLIASPVALEGNRSVAWLRVPLCRRR